MVKMSNLTKDCIKIDQDRPGLKDIQDRLEVELDGKKCN